MLPSSFSNNASSLRPGEPPHANGAAAADPHPHSHPAQQAPGSSMIHGNTMRLREEPPTVHTPAGRTSRKRKSPPPPAGSPGSSGANANASTANSNSNSNSNNGGGPNNPQAAAAQLVHALPPPHTLMQPHTHPAAAHGHMAPPIYTYDYTPGGMAPQPMHPAAMAHGAPDAGRAGAGAGGVDQALDTAKGGRQLSGSKRAEQNRKAQRAFRERRDQ
jgi:hypothetical protein